VLGDGRQHVNREAVGLREIFTRAQLGTVRDILAQAMGIAQIAKGRRLTRHTVYRIKAMPQLVTQCRRPGVFNSRGRRLWASIKKKQ
jgi:DNA invertase Pin-like site-specific DNA recombinase